MASNERKRYPLDQSPLYRLSSKRRLADLLHLSVRRMQRLARASDGLYAEWDDVNAKGKCRHIENPSGELKRVQKRVGLLLGRIMLPDFLYCPVKGRSYVGHAHRHLGSRVVRTLDVRAYFPSTPSRRVYWFFHEQMKCAPDVAGILAALSTFRGRLPTGSPLSPLLSYFAHRDMWHDVHAITRSANCRFSVYMDDMAISGEVVPEHVMWAIKRRIHGCGLRYHKEKCYSGGFAEVTGTILRDGELRLPKRQHLKLHELRRRLAFERDPDRRESLKRRFSGRLSQQRQLTQVGR